MPTGVDLVNKMMSQRGDRYVFGAEIRLGDPDPDQGDCSEYIEWACWQIGLRNPKMPDGSLAQINHCRAIPLSAGLATAGAVLWRPGHIVVSRGDSKTTIEARGAKYGVNVFGSQGRFSRAGLIPGLDYSNRRPSQPGMTTNDLQVIAWCVALCKTTRHYAGAKNDYIKWLQGGLNNVSGRGLKVDGHYGPATQRAVVDLKRMLGRRPDDTVVDRWVWDAIYP